MNTQTIVGFMQQIVGVFILITAKSSEDRIISIIVLSCGLIIISIGDASARIESKISKR